METTISELQLDLLRYIMILVAQSSDGAADVARAVSVCRVLMSAARDGDVLKAVVFDNVRIFGQYELFQHSNGLLNRCAQDGNVAAQYLLSKIVLVTSSQLLTRKLEKESSDFSSGGCRLTDFLCSSKIPKEDTLADSFMAHFMPGQASTSEASDPSLCHYDLVRLFLCRCSPNDFVEMRPHLNHYVSYFIGHNNNECRILYESMNRMQSSSICFRAMEDIRVRIENRVQVDGALMDFMLKSIQAGLPFEFEAIFGADTDSKALGDFYKKITTSFEDQRAYTIIAFGLVFP